MGLTGPTGAWTIIADGTGPVVSNWPEGTGAETSWAVNAVSAAGDAIPGRVWTKQLRAYSTAAIQENLGFWVVSEYGAQYKVDLDGFNGGGWTFNSDAFGNVDPGGSCMPAYESVPNTINSPEHAMPGAECGDPYNLFFEAPAADLPATTLTADGPIFVKPTYIVPTVSNASYQSTSALSRAGTLTYDLDSFTGSYVIRIDTNGNGAFDDAEDLSVPQTGTAGAKSYEWDGLNASGEPVVTCTPVSFQVAVDRTDEIHFVLGDTEFLDGIQITQLVGSSVGNDVVYWDDTRVPGSGGGVKTSTTNPVVNLDGLSSAGGVHGWAGTGNNPWGNFAAIDNWTYSPVDISASTTLPGNCLAVAKTSDATTNSRVGDEIVYTITATNNGSDSYTAESPAIVTDDLTAVLDDAIYNGDVTASQGGETTYTEPLLQWSGPLAAGASVTMTYTTTLVDGGDGSVRNVAFGGDGPTPTCDPSNGNGQDPQTGVACAEVNNPLPKLTITKSTDRTDLPAIGEEVSYTLTVTNVGPGAFTTTAPATATDNFTDVLDDATLDEASITASAGTTSYDAPALSWKGPLASGDSATITYTFTYTGGGDRILRNQACIPADDAAAGAEPCDVVTVPAAAVQQSKSVDPASGTAVRAGQEVTYTLTFDSVGKSAGTVDTFDDLSDVLDDATLTTGPTVNGAGLTATLNGEQIDISGSIEAGITETVSYTVTVDAYADQENHQLGNVLADPDGNACVPGPEACTTENPIQHLTVAKSSNAATDVNTGDTVTYTVTVTNDGESDFTADAPASATDDLSGVLDGARYNDNAEANTGTVAYAEPTLSWSGALAAGDAVTITYTVFVTNAGDHQLRNVASLPPELCDTADAPCESVVQTPLPHVVPTKASDPATGTDVVAGQIVTYTLSYTSDGLAPGTVDSTDNLTDVLDDATVTTEPTSSSAAVSAVRDGATLRVTGPVQPGETVTVTYQITIKADGDRGNNRAENVLIPDVPEEFDCTTGTCLPVNPPPVVHLMPELDDWKTVDPVSGSTVAPGSTVSYMLHFTNTGTAAGSVNREDVLTGVLDDADLATQPAASDAALTASAVTDGRFAVTGTLAAGQAVTVTYTVTVRADGQQGDDQLGNFIVNPGVTPPTECAVTGLERPDCTVNYVSNVVAKKSSDPNSGSNVVQGQQVTYTLTFDNTSSNPLAADAPIAYTDHMADVLDDATLSAEPTASSGSLSATTSGSSIVITGALATGATATVSYTVTVKQYAEQGNHALGNVIAITGTDPICVPNSALCTLHNTVNPPPGLSETGLSLGAAGIFAPLMVLVGAGILFARRRRRCDTASDEAVAKIR